jgi:hypothetical protein
LVKIERLHGSFVRGRHRGDAAPLCFRIPRFVKVAPRAKLFIAFGQRPQFSSSRQPSFLNVPHHTSNAHADSQERRGLHMTSEGKRRITQHNEVDHLIPLDK